MVRRLDRLVWRLDIDYEKTLSGEILPKGWRNVSFYDDGRIRESTQATDLQFSNRLKFEPSVFAPEFPTAAFVTDRTGGKKAEVYLVRKDGSSASSLTRSEKEAFAIRTIWRLTLARPFDRGQFAAIQSLFSIKCIADTAAKSNSARFPLSLETGAGSSELTRAQAQQAFRWRFVDRR